LGLESSHPQACLGCKQLLEGGFQAGGSINFSRAVGRIDNGVTGMVLPLLAYFAYPDERIHLVALSAKRSPDGIWNLQNRHAGKTFFEMEKVGQPSRWNTLRALRVLKWWES